MALGQTLSLTGRWCAAFSPYRVRGNKPPGSGALRADPLSDSDRPFVKDGLMHWTHRAAAIKETANGGRFAVDSAAGANGEKPTVQDAASFYVPGADNTLPEIGPP